ncbi:MAG: fumarylacetoacetate hydrolase [Novosphingobium sp. 28-62-57]|uniref:fumarylacetoacetate hydrolase family protein n=1 Tax=unclassified Novosphingobium TaxID=2644732 RepID=UPI000BCC90FE|nr:MULTISPECIES: fumarylacetoacetate hydrolase family protein [unclassified Novosphingobium]OYW49254.1 MAG: fumarylacetoacetate hydrolase [Novosphingobium sp. 12-62-10]OYZ09719.1 MAG: fumarylacetoacetate hydrolase [Novosphingobium sp. 28-62-57]OZA36823.1 MAG: fumarylacetoacetate hydrolase [Novosphingobium sp. 17-62-9]HQS68395.1 fumarylacetoacetate hydrolase family protein [Novosphingobium sp.]
MKLATLDNGTPDGALVVVSADGARYLSAADVAATLQSAIENWTTAAPALTALAEKLAAGGGQSTADAAFAAPMPRAWQWLDGSAFRSHGELMETLFGTEPPPPGRPLMYQGLSHQFLSATADVPMPREEDGIDFEGEFGVITDFVPMGVTPEAAMAHIKLIVQINDWSLRALAPVEMKTGFGWIHAKPACSVAPFAVTPDDLGDAWRDGRVHLPLTVDWNGQRFGNAQGGVMEFGFHDLVAHAASTRSLCAGTIIGSGTVSNSNFREIGSSCIAERRGIEMLDEGTARTAYMHFGDTVRMEARLPDGSVLFGAIDQKVVKG